MYKFKEKEGFSVMQTFFIVLHIIVTCLLIFVVMAQEGKDPGMRGIQGASADMGDSFFKRAGGTTKEQMFTKLTASLAILFLITTLVLVILVA
jgi:protein translocase SecG subunit